MIKSRPERIHCQNEIKKMVKQLKARGESPQVYRGELVLLGDFIARLRESLEEETEGTKLGFYPSPAYPPGYDLDWIMSGGLKELFDGELDLDDLEESTLPADT